MFFFIEVKDCQRCSAGYRVAAIGAAERTGRWRVHDFSTSNDATDWHASAHGLGNNHEVGFYSVVFDSEHSTGAAETRLNLVGDKKNVVLFADRFERS